MHTDSSSLGASEPKVIQEFDATEIQPIHFNRRYTFYRACKQNQSFVIKSAKTTPPDVSTIASLRHEYELLSGIDLSGIVKVTSLVQTGDALIMVMEDVGQYNLAVRLGTDPLSIAEFWEIGLQLAKAVGSLHEVGIIHRNLNPANIVWNPESRRATVVDFGIAISLSTLAVDRVSPAHLEGALAYISPEQTGRTGRSMDSRSDLYSLGATFYELLTGSLPFTARDPLELIHAHLARSPKAPHLINTNIPLALSSIILKLLEKEPEQRYLTAEALLMDLREASDQWSKTGTVIPFPLAQCDVPRQLSIPEKLYGRNTEIGILRDAFDRACKGQREFILVAGVPGIGKSALVNDLEQSVTERHGYFISGKFDQLQRSVPYTGLMQAFRMLVHQVLTEPDTALETWRERIQEAVAPNGQILIDVIPEIEGILGPQVRVTELGPVESKNRFNQVFTTFLGVFAKSGYPFVLFLDDLQWVDTASLRLIQQWISDDTTGHLLIAGAYRDDEVGLAHPLALALGELRKASVQIPEIHLGPLGRAEVAKVIADTLNQEPNKCVSLAELMVKKTAGNPFFIKRLLHALHSEALIRFVPQTRAWEWNMSEIERAPVSDNVLDLMVQSIDRLPEATKDLLQIGACIGHRFDLGTLAEVTERSRTITMKELWPALEDGLLLPLHEAYKAPRNAGPLDQNLTELPAVMRFVHDRVQQAAYMLLSKARRHSFHLSIGRRLLQRIPTGQFDGRLFDIVDQLNLGESLITDPVERTRVAELNLAAGRKAKASAAYQAAFDYLTIGRRQLALNTWDELPELTFAIYRELAECAYLTGLHSEAEQILEEALEHAPSKVAKADLYSLRVLAATVAGDWSAALRWGREGLAVFGHEWPLEGLNEANEAESLAVMKNVGSQRIDDLVDKPEVEDEETRACMRLLSILGPPAYFSGSEVLTFLVTRGTNLSLRYGPSVYSAYAYVFYGALHSAHTGEYDLGYAFGKLALALAHRFGNRAEESRTLEVFGLVVHAWKAPLRDSLPLMKEGYRAGVESGELAYAAFNLCGILINGLPAGVPLAELLDDSGVAIEFATKYQNRTSVEISVPFRQFARTLMGKTLAPTTFDDNSFDEIRFLEDAKDNQTAVGQFWVARLQAAYLFGDYETARRSSQEGAQYVSSGILGMVNSAEHSFYTALTMAAEYEQTPRDKQPALVHEVGTLHAQLATWAKNCPENFLHKQMLVEAELERMCGSPWKAIEFFGEAIERAQKLGFGQDTALAHELAGRLFLVHKQPRLADVYLRAAIEDYRAWGATAKVHALEEVYSDRVLAPMAYVGSKSSNRRSGLVFDALGLIRASQAIASETVPERLFERILQIVVEVAGAQAGILLLGNPAELRVRARISTEEGATIVFEDMALADCSILPLSIARYVTRLKESLVLDDAAMVGPFAADAQVRTLGLRSVLCVPLKKNVQVVGMLYLENNAMAYAFTAERVEVVQALAAQAANSLENSTLLLERERVEQELRLLANDLSSESQRKTEFLATLAHELRNPLAPIRTGLDLIRLSGHNPSAAAKIHETMERQLNQMVHLIDDLLDIARINSGKVHLKKERIELRDAISNAVEATLPLIEAAQHKLDVSIPEVPLVLHADPTRLAQILSNLLTNAAKYTPSGGRIRISVQNEDHDVKIVITDTGIGIPGEALDEVFNMFSQVSRAMGRSQGGLGIGLSLVRGLVQMHGGVVSAASGGEGQGSTFTVQLPLIAEADGGSSLPVGSGVDPNLQSGKNLKVLVADDNVDAARMMMALLEVSGHDVELVHDGPHAVEKAKGTRYDLAILDIGMPGLNGYEVAEAIRKIPGNEHTFLAALTGWGAEEDRNRSKNAGFDVHLTKPAGILEINQLLTASIDNKYKNSL